jgi:hypothetical protein
MKKQLPAHRTGAQRRLLSRLAKRGTIRFEQQAKALPDSVSIDAEPSPSPESAMHTFETAHTLNRFGKLL